MKVVQFFKIYNFNVMQIFTRSKDLKIFPEMQKNFIPLRKNTFDSKIIMFFGLKYIIVAKIMITSIFALKPKTKLKLLPRSELLHRRIYNFSKLPKYPYFVLQNFQPPTRINISFTLQTLF